MIKDLWYKNALIYSLHVGTFQDSNADGIGDFEGLTRRLDYLAGLGVTCVWLLPFQTSPKRDDGYDITNYFEVDPCYGTLGDFVQFTHEAEQRGIRVMIDLVINHTSNEHPWFKDACRSRTSKYRDYYVWSDKRPKDWNKGMVFPGVQKSTWTREPRTNSWYFHRFYDFQPDLNTSNPLVQEELRKVIGFWLQLGVSGFRMDAMPFVISTKGADKKTHEQYEMLHEMRDFLQWRRSDAIVLAEANVVPGVDFQYFGNDGDRLQMMFNFHVNQHLFHAMASGDARPLAQALQQTRGRPANAQWAHFLRNHDEIDLGRLTPEQRQVVFDKMGPEKSMQLYDRGIRRRLAPMLDGDRRRLENAYSLLFSMPGTPVVRYGDELGMGDDLRLKERNGVRTPMQWSREVHAGFSRAKKTVLPVIEKGPYRYDTVNAADQRRDPQSFLNWTERMIRMRKELPEVGWGDFEIVHVKQHGVLAMRFRWRDNSVLTLHNLTGDALEVELALGDLAGRRLVNLLTEDHSQADARGRHSIVMAPYGYNWYRVGGLGYILDRSST